MSALLASAGKALVVGSSCARPDHPPLIFRYLMGIRGKGGGEEEDVRGEEGTDMLPATVMLCA